MSSADASIDSLSRRSARRPVARFAGTGAAGTGVVTERLRARQRRISQIRRRVVAVATATFLATSGGIFLQLATGNDPALATSAAKTATSPTTAAAATPAASTSSGAATVSSSSGGSSSGTASGSTSSGSGNGAAVTTHQS